VWREGLRAGVGRGGKATVQWTVARRDCPAPDGGGQGARRSPVGRSTGSARPGGRDSARRPGGGRCPCAGRTGRVRGSDNAKRAGMAARRSAEVPHVRMRMMQERAQPMPRRQPQRVVGEPKCCVPRLPQGRPADARCFVAKKGHEQQMGIHAALAQPPKVGQPICILVEDLGPLRTLVTAKIGLNPGKGRPDHLERCVGGLRRVRHELPHMGLGLDQNDAILKPAQTVPLRSAARPESGEVSTKVVQAENIKKRPVPVLRKVIGTEGGCPVYRPEGGWHQKIGSSFDGPLKPHQAALGSIRLWNAHDGPAFSAARRANVTQDNGRLRRRPETKDRLQPVGVRGARPFQIGESPVQTRPVEDAVAKPRPAKIPQEPTVIGHDGEVTDPARGDVQRLLLATDVRAEPKAPHPGEPGQENIEGVVHFRQAYARSQIIMRLSAQGRFHDYNSTT